MFKKMQFVCVLFTIAALGSPATAAGKKRNETRESKEEITRQGPVVLWRNPGDIRSRNLFYGPGGEADAPRTVFTFVKEDMNGTNPKFTPRS